ncbi:MAG: 4a-hydroxytetrahydrobiopterin dehydratase [Gammaproteobacteria bacterium]|nr:4a-hydroxytetrahydrobiopterin dehydratase [Gammaproteobacteria bacterium]
MDDLCTLSCKPCEGGVAPLSPAAVQDLLRHVPQWSLNADATVISRLFAFRDYYKTMAFVNAIAFIAHRQDHHPDLSVHYNRCEVRYTTHAIGGLSENDFICAAKTDALLSGLPAS